MNTINKIGISFILFTCFAFTSCQISPSDGSISFFRFNCLEGEGEVITKTLDLEEFSSLTLRVPANVKFEQGDVQEVMVKGYSNILDDIEPSVRNNKLNIESKARCISDSNLEMTITLPSLEEVSIKGSGDIVIGDFTNQENFTGNIAGGGKIEINQFEGATDLEFNIAGSGEITANEDIKSLENIDIDIAGSGEYNGYALQSNHTAISIAGSGDTEVNASESLNISIAGSGKVSYMGSPDIKQSVAGSGNISKAK